MTPANIFLLVGLGYNKNVLIQGPLHLLLYRKWIYISPLLKYLTLKALRYRSHSVTCKLHRTCLYLVSIHQMAHPQTEVVDI